MSKNQLVVNKWEIVCDVPRNIKIVKEIKNEFCLLTFGARLCFLLAILLLCSIVSQML